MDKYQTKILVVDDYAINLELIKEMLEILHCQVDAVESAELALELFKKNDYDLIFMDIQMAGLDGYQATQAIRRLETGSKRVPIIALSASALPGEENKWIQAGLDGYLSKPVKIKDLEEVLQKFPPL